MEYLTEGTSTAKVDEPKPIQKPHIPIYLGGFSPHIFTRILKYDTIGWLGGIGGPIRTLRKSYENDKGERQHDKQGSKNLQVILLM